MPHLRLPPPQAESRPTKPVFSHQGKEALKTLTAIRNMRLFISIKFILLLSLAPPLFLLVSCIDSSSTGSIASASSSTSPSIVSPAGISQQLNKHDIALRFLTAYIRLDRNMALQYASPKAVNKLDWYGRHSENIPYYDDKMILYFNGGWARVYFQEVNGSYIVSDLEVHHR